LKRGEHIRVTLILQHVGAKAQRGLDIFCHTAGFFLAGALAWFSLRLVWQSYTFHDISQGNDATPLWIPQICMAVGAVVLCVAVADDLILLLRGEKLAQPSTDAEPAHFE
jgi:TRAP-type C4-dicarboxylate transport system permease small subunit